VSGGGRGAAGLTLVEFLFATSVIAFVLLGVAGMFPTALRNVVVGGHTSKASALAMQMAEAIRNDQLELLIGRYNGFSTGSLSNVNCLTLAPPTSFDVNYIKKKWFCDLQSTGGEAGGRGLPYGTGVVSVTCRNPDGSANNSSPCSTGLVRVTVTVRWEKNLTRSLGYSFYVARRD